MMYKVKRPIREKGEDRVEESRLMRVSKELDRAEAFDCQWLLSQGWG